MLLASRGLVGALTDQLKGERQALEKEPALALVWVGNDGATGRFVRAKQRLADTLNCKFYLYHLEQANQRQLLALISSLNNRREVDGIVLQLPLPDKLQSDELIANINRFKDIDALNPDNQYNSPTPTGIISLLEHYNIDPANNRTIILGAGKLVGGPLARIFQAKKWPFEQITRDASLLAEKIRQFDILIAATGHAGLVTPDMVNKDMIVIDGSGVDVDPKVIEPSVRAVTPARGGIGPLTVSYLYKNLLQAAKR